MVEEAEFKCLRAAVAGALGRGTGVAGDPGQDLRIVDAAAVMAALDAAWEGLRPPAPPPGGRAKGR